MPRLVKLIQSIEAAGFDGAGILDSQMLSRDTFVVLGQAAAQLLVPPAHDDHLPLEWVLGEGSHLLFQVAHSRAPAHDENGEPALGESEAPALFAMHSDPRVARYLSRPAWTDIEQAHSQIARDAQAHAAGTYLRLGIERLDRHDMIGECSLFNISEQSRRAEVGYAMAASAWGRGYMHEALIALQLEANRSKAEILQLYLNDVYYGRGAYGVEAAARVYFGIGAANLDLAHAAYLAGLPQRPSEYDSVIDEAARARQTYVLGRMVDDGWITKAQAGASATERIEILPASLPPIAHQFVAFARAELARLRPDLAGRDGLIIETTLDGGLQAESERLVRLRLETLRDRNATDAALVAIELVANVEVDAADVEIAEKAARYAEDACLITLALDTPVHLELHVEARELASVT